MLLAQDFWLDNWLKSHAIQLYLRKLYRGSYIWFWYLYSAESVGEEWCWAVFSLLCNLPRIRAAYNDRQ